MCVVAELQRAELTLEVKTTVAAKRASRQVPRHTSLTGCGYVLSRQAAIHPGQHQCAESWLQLQPRAQLCSVGTLYLQGVRV